jgi:hypothetical protein
MLETTERERLGFAALAEWRLRPTPRAADDERPYPDVELSDNEMMRRLCRDVDTVVGALGVIANAPLEKGSSFRVLNQIRTEARELLRDPQAPEPARWHEGMRQAQPHAFNEADVPPLCWRYVGGERVCILERGHDHGEHEPAATGSEG